MKIILLLLALLVSACDLSEVAGKTEAQRAERCASEVRKNGVEGLSKGCEKYVSVEGVRSWKKANQERTETAKWKEDHLRQCLKKWLGKLVCTDAFGCRTVDLLEAGQRCKHWR